MGIAGGGDGEVHHCGRGEVGQLSLCPQPDLKDVIADDFQGTSPSGRRYGKDEAITTDTKSLSRDCQLGEVKVRFSATPSRSRMERKARSPRLKMARRQSIV